MKSQNKPANEAIKQLRSRRVGPRPLSRAACVQPNAAARWLDGSAKPRPEAREKIEAAFGVAPADWDRAPTVSKKAGARKSEKTIQAKSASSSPIPPPDDSAITVDDVFAELARLRAFRQQAEADENLSSWLELESTTLRVLRRLALANGETSTAAQVRTHPATRELAREMLDKLADHPEAAAATRKVLEAHGVDVELVEGADDPEVIPGPNAAARGLAALLQRVARVRSRLAGGPLAIKVLRFEARARDAARKLEGDEPTLVQSAEWHRLKTALLGALETTGTLEILGSAEPEQEPGPNDVRMNACCAGVCCNPVRTAEETLEIRRKFAAGGRVIWYVGPPCPRQRGEDQLLAVDELPPDIRDKYIADRKRRQQESWRLARLDPQ